MLRTSAPAAPESARAKQNAPPAHWPLDADVQIPAGVAVTELEADAAEDQAEKHEQHRDIERGQEHGIEHEAAGKQRNAPGSVSSRSTEPLQRGVALLQSKY